MGGVQWFSRSVSVAKGFLRVVRGEKAFSGERAARPAEKGEEKAFFAKPGCGVAAVLRNEANLGG